MWHHLAYIYPRLLGYEENIEDSIFVIFHAYLKIFGVPKKAFPVPEIENWDHF